MLTEYQQGNFEKNRKTYAIFEKVMKKMKNGSEVKTDFVIDFFNSRNELKIDIISNISNEFVKQIPTEWCEQIMVEILQMENKEIDDIFFGYNSIELSNEKNSIKSFIIRLSKYERCLNYDFSILQLYAKHVGVLV